MNENQNSISLDVNLHVKPKNRAWEFFTPSTRHPSKLYQSTADTDPLGGSISTNELSSADKVIELISQGNKDIIKTLKEFNHCVMYCENDDSKLAIKDPMKNFRDLKDVVRAFDGVNQFDRQYFLSILGAEHINDLDEKDRKKLEKVCLITHDNRQYCKFIHSQIIPQMQTLLDNMGENHLNDNDKDILEINSSGFKDDIAYLESIVKFMEMEREGKEQIFNFHNKMTEYVDFLQKSLVQDQNNLNISLNCDFQDRQIPILVNRVVLKSVFSMVGNLCKNSVQANASKISVKCNLAPENNYDVTIKVRDNGKGIKDINTEKFFDESSRDVASPTKQDDDINHSINDINRHEGTLNANAALISSGGTIRISDNVVQTCENKKNHGVEFEMNMPTLNNDLTSDFESELSQGHNVLVIDDVKRMGLRFTARDLLLKEDSGFKKFLRNDDKHYVLRSNGFNYVFVSDAIDAINVADSAIKLGATFDFVISDLFIPNIEGNKIIRMLKDLDSFLQTKFILNTGEKKDDINDKTLFEDERVLCSDDGKGALVSYVSAIIRERTQMAENDVNIAATSNGKNHSLSHEIHEELQKMQIDNHDSPSNSVHLSDLVKKMEGKQIGNGLNILCLVLLL